MAPDDGAAAPAPEGRALSPIAQAREQWPAVAAEVAKALPSHITVERFERVVFNALAGNPDLLEADRRSLWTACSKAANDGLMPDGREGAIVTTFDRKTGRLLAQWMPMIAGVLKVARNSGEVLSITANVVYEGEHFRVTLGDEEKIEHTRDIAAPKSRGPIAVYAIATLRNGERVREVMSWGEIEDVRRASKSGDRGPWGSWPGEMARKTVIRRMAKRLPRSSDRDADLHRVIERVDEEYDFGAARGERPQERQEARRDPPPTIDGEAEPAPEASENAARNPRQPGPSGDPAQEVPAIAYVAADGKAHAYPDVAAWRADWLKRVKVLAQAGRLAELREAGNRNARAIRAVADLAPLTADEVVEAIRGALGPGPGGGGGDAPPDGGPGPDDGGDPGPAPDDDFPGDRPSALDALRTGGAAPASSGPPAPEWYYVASDGSRQDFEDPVQWRRAWMARVQAAHDAKRWDALRAAAAANAGAFAAAAKHAPLTVDEVKAQIGVVLANAPAPGTKAAKAAEAEAADNVVPLRRGTAAKPDDRWAVEPPPPNPDAAQWGEWIARMKARLAECAQPEDVRTLQATNNAALTALAKAGPRAFGKWIDLCAARAAELAGEPEPLGEGESLMGGAR